MRDSRNMILIFVIYCCFFFTLGINIRELNNVFYGAAFPAQRPRLSRLADLAGCLPLTIVLGFKDVDNANEDTEPKAKSARTDCWAHFFSIFPYATALFPYLVGKITIPFSFQPRYIDILVNISLD
jgi:hypothetical protein